MKQWGLNRHDSVQASVKLNIASPRDNVYFLSKALNCSDLCLSASHVRQSANVHDKQQVKSFPIIKGGKCKIDLF